MKEAQPGATSFKEKFCGGMDLCYVGQTFAFKVEKPLKPQLDEFYKEPLNVRILHSMRWSMCATRWWARSMARQLLDAIEGRRYFSNALLEYMAVGLTTVATQVGGNREIIQHQVNGLLVPPFRQTILMLWAM